MSAELSSGERPEPLGALRVQALFRVSGEQAAQAVAAKMIDSAHEIANLPDCECDVDVSVEWEPPGGSPGGAIAGPPGSVAAAAPDGPLSGAADVAKFGGSPVPGHPAER